MQAETIKSKIAVLLTTYNGACFLSEQLDSLLNQSYQDFEVIIHDDGSTDSTLEIIENYIKKYPDKFRLLKDNKKHRGARDSFFYLLRYIECEYYMFCDQDDYWLPNKIEISLKKIKEIEKKNPGLAVMIHTDLIIVDKNLNILYNSFWKWGKFNVDLNKRLHFAPFGNVFTGCTMIINNQLKQYIFPIPTCVEMHDQWIGLMAVKYGKVDNIKQTTIKYRQHGKNVCSIGNKKKFSLGILFRRSNWYQNTEPLLQTLNYGSKLKAYLFKFLYSSSRIFYHN